MNEDAFDEIKRFIIQKLNQKYGFCGLADSDNHCVIHSSTADGRTITIEIKIEK